MKDLSKLTDDELILNLKNGDADSVTFLINKYKNMASKIVHSYFLIGSEPEDLMQEAMIGLCIAYNSYDTNSPAQFSTYAYTCINRRIQSIIKSANTNKHKALNTSVSLNNLIETKNNDFSEEIYEPCLYIPSDVQDPEDILIEQEKIAQIHKIIDIELSEKERNVLNQFLNGFSYTEIANNLSISTKAVDNSISRAKSKLTQALK